MTPANVISLAERRARRDAEQHQADRDQAQRMVRTVLSPTRVLSTPVNVVPLWPRDDGPGGRAA